MNKTPEHFRFGFAALVGRPNVGKSTLMNQLIGQKISITSHRAQTTRHRILGISTDEDQQIVFVDTPGIHKGTKTMNKVINRTAILSTEGVDMVVLMIDSKGWKTQDKKVLDLLKGRNVPMILVINKVDMLKDKKPMVIGKQGARLKSVGSKARLGIELLFGKKVFLELWVKVRSGWADSQRDIQRLGYGEGF
jgi:small GTP-binding protein